jgi:beta-RFAP synthase
MTPSLRITAPSRLHFGLLRFSQESGPSYGGLGMMIDRPRVEVELSAADEWSVSGPYGERALELARRSLQACLPSTIRAVKVDVRAAPAPHSGLGAGTQLALAIAAGVRQLCQAPPLEIERLVTSVGRGRRSAVGSHGFQLGGLIWEEGRRPGQSLSDLKRRVEVPTDWRIVLVTMPHSEGLSGEHERRAFESLPPVPTDVTCQLTQLAEEQILPAAEQQDFDTFGEAVFQYGRLAGSCFARLQGGPFASPQIAAGVCRMRELGVRGVGQSSWGPTLFAFAADENSAADLIDRLAAQEEFADAQITCTPPNNGGAFKTNVVDRVHGQESRTGCKIQ